MPDFRFCGYTRFIPSSTRPPPRERSQMGPDKLKKLHRTRRRGPRTRSRYGVLTQAEQRSAGVPEHFGEIHVQHVRARVPSHAVQQVLLGIGAPIGGRHVGRRRVVGRGPHDADTGRQPVRVDRVEHGVHRVHELGNVGVGVRGGTGAAAQHDGRQQGDEGVGSGPDHLVPGLSARVTGPARRLSGAAMGRAARARDAENLRDALSATPAGRGRRRYRRSPHATRNGVKQPTRRIVLRTNQTRDGVKKYTP